MVEGAGAAVEAADDRSAAFSARTRRWLTATRVVAYSLAVVFMIVMVVRGLWLTAEQRHDEAERSIDAAVAALTELDRAGPLNEAAVAALLTALAPANVEMLAARGDQVRALAGRADPDHDVRTLEIGQQGWSLVAVIDTAAISRSVVQANVGYLIFVLALGLPIIFIFLQMGRLVNQPALRLLSYAQAPKGDKQRPPEMPTLWGSVVERLKELRESQAQMQAFLDNAPLVMAFHEPTGMTIRMINRHGADYFGLQPDELVGRDAGFLRAHFPDFDQNFAVHLQTLIETRTASAFETEFRPDGHRTIKLLSTIFPVLDDAGQIELVGWIMLDVTDQRRAQEELTRSTAALHRSEKLAALGSMLAGVSHELNNPLAAVIGQATLLAEDLQHTDHSDRINKIRRAADRCARIVQSFLAMARQKAPEYRSVDVNDQIRAAVELTEYQMRAANVHIELRLSSRLPMIEADSDQLHQVFVNLLTNARQAMEDTSDDRRITISTERVQQSIRITVADTGKGIPPEVRDRIFDPFFTTKDAGSGTGIGLSYSLGIIEAHRGTLRLEDSPVGTVFAITLPVSDAAEPADAPKAEAPRRIKGHALVIDDEVDVADTLADMLRRTGLEVTVVVGGRAGQGVLASGVAFDIVLSDIRMPDYDGPTLYAWLLANRPELAGRIAFVTGDTLSGLAADFIAASGCRVLEKPFTPAGLRDLIRRMLDA